MDASTCLSMARFVRGVADGGETCEKPFEPHRMRVFISGPMSGRPHYNAVAFAEAHALLRERGALVIFDPSWEWMRDTGESEQSHEVYLRRCIHELTRNQNEWDDCHSFYDAVVQLDGWQESAGAMTEYLVACACGIRCVPIEELRTYAGG